LKVEDMSVLREKREEMREKRRGERKEER